VNGSQQCSAARYFSLRGLIEMVITALSAMTLAILFLAPLDTLHDPPSAEIAHNGMTSGKPGFPVDKTKIPKIHHGMIFD
jgi:hypothetical protein